MIIFWSLIEDLANPTFYFDFVSISDALYSDDSIQMSSNKRVMMMMRVCVCVPWSILNTALYIFERRYFLLVSFEKYLE